MTQPRPHPHFDDRGTLHWHTAWKDALAEARREHKLVFVEFGREACGLCRALVQSVVPHAQIAPLLRQHFVALASDCDDAEDQVNELAMNLQDATMLPFVMFADGSGKFLGGSSGAVNPVSFKRTLEELVKNAPVQP
jgi:thioredoxin-related protein